MKKNSGHNEMPQKSEGFSWLTIRTVDIVLMMSPNGDKTTCELRRKKIVIFSALTINVNVGKVFSGEYPH